MEIRVVEEKGRSQIEVTILSGSDDWRVAGIVRQLQMADGKISGYVPGTIKRRIVFLADVAWIETSENASLIHLATGETLESVLASPPTTKHNKVTSEGNIRTEHRMWMAWRKKHPRPL